MRMVCEAVLGCICNVKLYLAEGKKFEDTVLSLSDRNYAKIITLSRQFL